MYFSHAMGRIMIDDRKPNRRRAKVDAPDTHDKNTPLHPTRKLTINCTVTNRGVIAYRKQSISVILRGLGDPKTQPPPIFARARRKAGMLL
jgi:hypothetical protein